MPKSHMINCSIEGCLNRHGDLGFEKILAHKNGWFVTRDQKEFCPEHVPEWVAKWRLKKAQEVRNA